MGRTSAALDAPDNRKTAHHEIRSDNTEYLTKIPFMSARASAPKFGPESLRAFAQTFEAVLRVFLDDGMISEIAGFLGACHNLDSTCRAIMDVNRQVGEYTLSKAVSDVV